MINSNNESVLMILCESQQRLLNYELWFIPELLELIGIRDINGMTATMIYRNFYDTDLHSYGYRRLLQAEVDWKQCEKSLEQEITEFMQLSSEEKTKQVHKLREIKYTGS